MSIKLAVALPVFNGSKYLTEQLDSILKQKSVQVDVFIKDDASSDNSPKLIDSYKSIHKNITVIKSVNRSGSASYAFFDILEKIPVSNYDYISLSDQDDIWELEKLDRAVSTLINTNTDCYSSNVTAFWPSGNEVIIKKNQPQQKYDYMFEAAGPGCTYIFNNRVALDLQSFLIMNSSSLSDIRHHDWFIYAFARTRGYKWIIDEISSLKYRQHKFNDLGVNLGIRAIIKRLSLIKDYKYANQIWSQAKCLGYEDQLKSLMRNPMNFRYYRRRKRDRFILFLISLFGYLRSRENL